MADETDDVEVRVIAPDDASALSELIERCYGDTYPKRVMYQPDELAKLLRSRAYGGVVATAGADVVGHIGFARPAPAATVVEAGTTVVDPRARGKGVMGRLALALGAAVASEGVSGFIHFPTTAHPVMQRASLSAGGRETGVMLAYLPPETRDTALGAPQHGRLAVTVVYQPVLEAAAQDVHLPRRYESLILGMADDLGLARSSAGPRRTPTAASRLSSTYDAGRGLLRISVERIGADAAAAAAAAAALVHVDLPLNDPGIDHAVEMLRRSSFAFAAWLPGWAGHDVLRMQRVDSPSDVELSPTLASPEAGALLRMIRAESPGAD